MCMPCTVYKLFFGFHVEMGMIMWTDDVTEMFPFPVRK